MLFYQYELFYYSYFMVRFNNMNSVINFNNVLAVGVGAALGAWCRWLLGLLFNSVMIYFPLGTLAANLFGGLLMGIVIGLIGLGSLENPGLRLFITTGFLGGLTTFSAFTGESITLLHKQDYFWALVHTCSHVFGALIMAFAGLALVQYMKH